MSNLEDGDKNAYHSATGSPGAYACATLVRQVHAAMPDPGIWGRKGAAS